MPQNREYPYEDGDVTVLGPEIFASKDGAVISWRGENYARQMQPDFRSPITISATASETAGEIGRQVVRSVRKVAVRDDPRADWGEAAVSLDNVIHQAELPIDDRPHGIDIYSEILHAAVRRPGHVDVWYIARPPNTHHMRRSFQIVATGQTFPAWLGRHHKTAITPDGQSEWHVVESHCTHEYVTETPNMRDRKDRVPGFCEVCGVDLVGDGDGGWTPRCSTGLS